MKKILFLLLALVSLQSYSQNKNSSPTKRTGTGSVQTATTNTTLIPTDKGSSESVTGLSQQQIQQTVGINNVVAWGATPDNPNDDDFPAIQACAFYAAYSPLAKSKVVYFPHGVYHTNHTTQVTDGDNRLGSVVWYGEGGEFAYDPGAANFKGAIIKYRGGAGAAVTIQGGYNILIQGVGVEGQNMASMWYGREQLVKSNYLKMNHAYPNADADHQFASYSGFAIDPYTGSRRLGVTYPNQEGVKTQWNKSPSSIIKIINSNISHFATGIIINPCGGDGQAEFVLIQGNRMHSLVTGFSSCATQNRLNIIRGNYIDRVWCAITNNTHGNQQGRITLSENNHISGHHYIDLGNMAWNGGFVSQHNYAESLVKIGHAGNTNTNAASAVFINDTYSLGHHQQTAIPTGILTGNMVAMYHTTISGLNLDFSLVEPPILEDCHLNIDATYAYDPVFHRQKNLEVYKQAYKLHPQDVGPPKKVHANHSNINIDNFTYPYDATTAGTMAFSNYPEFKTVAPGSTNLTNDYLWKSKSNGTNVLANRALNGINFSFILNGWNDETVAGLMGIGDILYLQGPDVKFMITGRTGNKFTSVMLNGFKFNGQTFAFEGYYDFDPATMWGNNIQVFWFNTNLYETRATKAAGDGTNVLKNVAYAFAADDNDTTPAAQFKIGSYINMYTYTTTIEYPSSGTFRRKITAINPTAGTITLDGNCPLGQVYLYSLKQKF